MRSWKLFPGKAENMPLEVTPSCQKFYFFLAYVNQLKFFIPCKSYNVVITNNIPVNRMAR
jgi:hypothetical protein